MIVHETLADRPTHGRLGLPPEKFDWADQVSETWREWIVGSGVDVVGDLDDLRPVRPSPDAVWLDPERARPRDVASAALDGLAAAVQEAARRPDPDGQLGARVSKVAKRLRKR